MNLIEKYSNVAIINHIRDIVFIQFKGVYLIHFKLRYTFKHLIKYNPNLY